jgi:sulfite reductase (NADPH) flavoprotein alpha-component
MMAEQGAAPAKPLAILFGSQTGTAEGLAKKTAKEAGKRGFGPKLVCMDKHESLDLANAENLLVITSTYGDGDPPDNAQGFWSYLSSDAAPRLDGVRFSVLALGDTNYPAFCEFGKKCDARIEQLGAKRVHPRADCDVDYEAPAAAWAEGVFTALGGIGDMSLLTPINPIAEVPTRKRPFPAHLLVNRELTRDGSEKEVRHFEISLEGSGTCVRSGRCARRAAHELPRTRGRPARGARLRWRGSRGDRRRRAAAAPRAAPALRYHQSPRPICSTRLRHTERSSRRYLIRSGARS